MNTRRRDHVSPSLFRPLTSQSLHPSTSILSSSSSVQSSLLIIPESSTKPTLQSRISIPRTPKTSRKGQGLNLPSPPAVYLRTGRSTNIINTSPSVDEPIMSSYYHYNAHQHPTPANPSASSSHHSGRGRRAPRLSQNSHKQFRSVRKEEEAIAVTNFRQRFEAGRSFDLDDDMEFCPALLTDSDMHSIHSSGSDRSSLSSGSPEHSPQSHQVTPDTFSLNSNSSPYVPAYQSQPTTLKLHQPAATRIRNAIPIVNPSTGVRMTSPPASVSPSRLQQSMNRRW